MFLHIGGNISVPKKNVVGIFDAEKMKKSTISKEFLDLAKSEGIIEYSAPDQKRKSFIITTEKIYYSPISSLTLQKRAENVIEVDKEKNE